MTSGYSVHEPDRPHEVGRLSPITPEDKRFPKRTANGTRKRKRPPRPAAPPTGAEPDADDATPAPAGDDDHVIDALV